MFFNRLDIANERALCGIFIEYNARLAHAIDALYPQLGEEKARELFTLFMVRFNAYQRGYDKDDDSFRVMSKTAASTYTQFCALDDIASRQEHSSGNFKMSDAVVEEMQEALSDYDNTTWIQLSHMRLFDKSYTNVGIVGIDDTVSTMLGSRIVESAAIDEPTFTLHHTFFDLLTANVLLKLDIVSLPHHRPIHELWPNEENAIISLVHALCAQGDNTIPVIYSTLEEKVQLNANCFYSVDMRYKHGETEALTPLYNIKSFARNVSELGSIGLVTSLSGMTTTPALQEARDTQHVDSADIALLMHHVCDNNEKMTREPYYA